MRELVTILSLGLVRGLQSALLAVGLVLIYQARRFVNFSQGQLGVVAASVVGVLVIHHGWPYAIALPIGLAAGPLIGLAVEALLSRRFEDAPPTTLVIATIGITQILLIAVLTGPLAIDSKAMAGQGFPEPFTAHVDVGGYVLSASDLLTIVLAPLLVLGLQLFITRTRLGTAIRGVASNRDAAQLSGVSVRRTSMIVWGIAGFVSAVAAVLNAPGQSQTTFAIAGTGLLIRGLAAALAGGLADFRVAFGAAIALGIAEQAVLFRTDTPGLADLTVFLFLVAMLALRARRGLAGRVAGPAPEAREGRAPVRPAHARAGWVGLFAVLAMLPLVPGLQSQEKALLLTLIVVYALTGLSVVLLSGWAGQVSMGQFAFVGVGAFVAARLFDQHLSAVAVLLEAGFVTAIATVVVGLPTLRLGRLFMAVSTLGFAFAAQAWLFRAPWFTGRENGYMYVDRIHVLGAPIRTVRSVYVIALVVLALVALLLRTVRESSLGRAIIAVRDNEDLAAANGIDALRTKLAALALSGFIAGLAGAVFAMTTRQWSYDSFPPETSIVVLAVAIVGSLNRIHGPILGAFAVFAWPYLVPDANTLAIRSLTSGALLLVVLMFAPGGLAGLVAAAWARRFPAAEGARKARALPEIRVPHPPVERPEGRLQTFGVTKRYGGIVAVDDVTLRVEPGEIVGIIGGNGAGKSTLLDCISGRQAPDSGRIELDGADVSRLGAQERAARGLARTFQDASLYPGLSAEESVLVALDQTNPTSALSAALGTPWSHLAELEKRIEVDGILEAFGLQAHADKMTSSLSTGMRRICALGAAIAPGPGIILLDEPTAGLAQREVEAFGALVRSLRDDFGASVLIIEHDIPLLTGMCDRLYCMELGAVIAEGEPHAVVADPRVIATCLGTDETAILRSGARSPIPRRPRRRLVAAQAGADPTMAPTT